MYMRLVFTPQKIIHTHILKYTHTHTNTHLSIHRVAMHFPTFATCTKRRWGVAKAVFPRATHITTCFARLVDIHIYV